jgi:hypothetical protein
MQRHGRIRAEFAEPAHWARFVRAVRDCSAVSVYGAFREGRLATYVLTCRDGAWLHGLVKMQRTEELEYHTSCALDAWVLAEAAQDPTIEGLVNAWVLGADENLRQYKRSMGFEELPLRRVTQVHPALRFLARRWTSRTVGALATGLPRVAPLRSLAKLSAAAFTSTVPGDAAPRMGP